MPFEPRDQIEQGRLGRLRRQLVLEREHAALDRLRRLVAHVDRARGILADQHHGETGYEAMARLEARHVRRDVGANFGGDGFAIDGVGGHGRKSSLGSIIVPARAWP
jgi:hypothetical protein